MEFIIILLIVAIVIVAVYSTAKSKKKKRALQEERIKEKKREEMRIKFQSSRFVKKFGTVLAEKATKDIEAALLARYKPNYHATTYIIRISVNSKSISYKMEKDSSYSIYPDMQIDFESYDSLSRVEDLKDEYEIDAVVHCLAEYLYPIIKKYSYLNFTHGFNDNNFHAGYNIEFHVPKANIEKNSWL